MSYLKSSDNCTVGTIRQNSSRYNVLYVKINTRNTHMHTHIGTYIKKGTTSDLRVDKSVELDNSHIHMSNYKLR